MHGQNGKRIERKQNHRPGKNTLGQKDKKRDKLHIKGQEYKRTEKHKKHQDKEEKKERQLTRKSRKTENGGNRETDQKQINKNFGFENQMNKCFIRANSTNISEKLCGQATELKRIE